MGAQSTELERWLAIDAGGTRIRVGAVTVGASLHLLHPVWHAHFEPEGDAQSRVALAVAGIQQVSTDHGWEAPHRLALAWAGAPTDNHEGIREARFGPAIPDLVGQLCRKLKLVHRPVLHSDARAGLQGGIVSGGWESAYGLISGTGLGEAWCTEGRCWSRQRFLTTFGRAADWRFQSTDGENWLRAASWLDAASLPTRTVEALRRLVDDRLARTPDKPQAILLGGHFARWFERGWIDEEQARSWWGTALGQLPLHANLTGVVRLEQLRITTTASEPA